MIADTKPYVLRCDGCGLRHDPVHPDSDVPPFGEGWMTVTKQVHRNRHVEPIDWNARNDRPTTLHFCPKCWS